MSDLYLVLRSTLPTVGKRYEWVKLGKAAMRAARRRKGLSYEGTARLLNVSAKTYERYEKRGEVPRHEVPNVATVLGLEIEMPESIATRIILSEEPLSDEEARASELLARLERVEGLAEQVLELVQAIQSGPPPRRAANGDE